MAWNDRIIPYPILTPANDDYAGARFELHAPEPVRSGGSINIPFRLDVSSETLKALVGDAKAQYVIQMSCPQTSMRDTYPTSHAEDILILSDGDFADALTLTPYILAVDAISDFKSGEHAPEWQIYRPEGFSIPAAGIMAVGGEVEIELAPSGIGSVIDLVEMRGSDGMLGVDLDGEHIVISVGPDDKRRIDRLRTLSERNMARAALYPALYLHAITSAIQALAEYEGRRWAKTIVRQIEDNGIGVDIETIQANPLHYAQLLMQRPLAAYLDAALPDDDF